MVYITIHTIQTSDYFDCINRPKDLINKAIELGLGGICITDHECLSSHVEVNKIAKSLLESNPDFKIALGNEIYLTDTRDLGQKYYHFILIAKDAKGHKALRELSSTAWYYSYYDRGLERVPTLKYELKKIMEKYKGHVIATSACMGGELSSEALNYANAMAVNDVKNAKPHYDNIISFINYCISIFGKDDFYIECAPSSFEDQIIVNKQLKNIADTYGIKMVVGTDAHYLTSKDREVHKAYLNSQNGEREVDDFYKFAHLMDSDEVENLLSLSFEKDYIEKILNNTIDISNKIEFYDLFHKQDIPKVEVKEYPKFMNANPKYPNLKRLWESDDVQDRYWINQCAEALERLNLSDNKEYWEELEEEARVKSIISEKLETNMFCYPNTLQHYIDMIWDCGSMVGAGRGSSCAALNHYLLGITQLNPIEWNLPFFRYMNEERVELGDIDIDICPSKRPLILRKIQEERSSMFNDDIPQWAKENLGCTLIATFGTESTKSAILTACRGYRSEDYPDGIEVDDAQYMSSLIPQERGFLWSIKDVIYGNEEKGRKPITSFINEVNKYPGLLDIIIAIDGVKNKRSSHASGVILFDNDPFEYCSFMKTPKGEIIAAFDLHDLEYLGNTKYDFLVTEVQDKLVQTIQLLQKDGQIEPDLSLREVYNKYFHPNVLPKDDERIWNALANDEVINVFQFDSLVGRQAAKLIKPKNVSELSDANGLMRLMAQDGEEQPLEKYVRFKNDISLWYKEMTDFGLTKEEQKYLEPYFKSSYGVPPSQEQLMLMLMDKNICGFSLSEANTARKIVGKKQMEKIPELRDKVLKQASSRKLGEYVWKHGAGPQMGYSFSLIHSLAYSFIGAQTLYIATNWDPIYWNTGCLIVNSGSLQDNSTTEIVDIYEPEHQEFSEGTTFEDLPDRSGKIKRTSSTDYSKTAKALGEIINAGIKVSLVDINNSDFGFKPDVKNNQILFGMKALLNVSDDLVFKTIENRPYISPKDFINKVKPNKQAMISLIKGGAFDNMMDRTKCMIWYIWETCDKKKAINLRNMGGLIKNNLLPERTKEEIDARRIYEFNRYLKSLCKNKDDDIYYHLNDRAIEFLNEMEYDYLFDIDDTNKIKIKIKDWTKIYQSWMDVFRKWISDNHDDILNQLNFLTFKNDWDKYAKGNLSSWEMEALCFYYHEHELEHINKNRYNFVDFFSLPEYPIIENSFEKGGKTINLYKLNKISGTCIAKDKNKSSVSLLTTTGVVNVKFRKEYFALFDKQISEKQPDGTKKVIEKSWFNRGNMIIVQGIRQGDNFIAKKYSSTPGHTLYHILEITKDGEIITQSERYKGGAV